MTNQIDPTLPQAPPLPGTPPLPGVPGVPGTPPDQGSTPTPQQSQEQQDQEGDPLVPHPEQWTITDVPADAPTETQQMPSPPDADEG